MRGRGRLREDPPTLADFIDGCEYRMVYVGDQSSGNLHESTIEAVLVG